MTLRRVWLWCVTPLFVLAWLFSGLSFLDSKPRTSSQPTDAINTTWCTALSRDGTQTPSLVINATGLSEAAMWVHNPGDSVNFSCLLRPQHRQDELYDGDDDKMSATSAHKSAEAAGTETWFVMLGEPTLATQAPFTSRAALFFRNSSHSYQRWHGRLSTLAAQPLHRLFSRQNRKAESAEEATLAASQKATATSYVVPLYDYADHHSTQLAYTHTRQRESASRILRFAANVLPEQYWSCSHRLRELAHTVLHYPWYNPMALTRLFYTRQLRLRFLVDRWTTLNDGTSLLFDEAGRRDSTAEDIDDVGVMLDGSAVREVHQHGRAFALAEGLIRRLRIVSFPPTPLRVERNAAQPPPTWQSTSDPTAAANTEDDDDAAMMVLPPVRVETRLVCDFRTVLDARAHVRESAKEDRAARRYGSPFAFTSGRSAISGAMSSLLSLQDEDYDLDDEGDVRGVAPAPRGALGWLSSLIAYLFRRLTLPLHRLTASVHEDALHYNNDGMASTAMPTPSQRLAREYTRLVREELGPRQAPRSVVPEWLRQLLGRQVLVSRRGLVERRQERERHITEDIHTDAAAVVDGDEVIRAARSQVTVLRVTTTEYWFHFTTTLPATRTMCLGLEALPRPRRRGHGSATRKTTLQKEKHAMQAEDSMAAQYADAVLHNNDDEDKGTAHKPGVPTPDVDTVQLYVEEFLSFDTVWLRLMLLAMVLLLVQPYVECSRLAHFCVAALCGAVVLLVFLLLYISRELRNMTVGKAGLLVVLAVGGVAAVAEGLLSAGAHVLRNMDPARQAEWYMYGTLLLILLGALSSVAIHILLPAATLRRATRWGFVILMIATLMLAWARNREATVLAALLYVVGRSRYGLPWLLSVLFANITPRCTTGTTYCPLTNAEREAALNERPTSCPRSQQSTRIVYDTRSSGGIELNDPQERLPAEARCTVAYATPLVAEAYDYVTASPRTSSTREGSYGKTPSNRVRLSRLTHAQKMRKFESDGAEFTRRALEQLAQRVREQPGQYATRLRDPNGLQRWAGMQDDDSSDSSSSSQ